MVRALFTVGGWTLLSRVLGFVRDILVALVLGAGPAAEAFFVAFRLPNMFRRIFAEGAYAAAFVPMLSGKLADGDRDGAARFASNALAWLSLVLILLSALALVFMPILVDILAPGFSTDQSKRALTIALGRITFAYLLCMALTAHFSSVLNALGHFAAAAAAPVLLNVFFIVGLLLIFPFTGAPSYVLAWSAFFAGIAQVALVVIALHKVDFRVQLLIPRPSPEMKRLLKLMIPGTISAGVQQINLLVGTRLVSGIAGAVAYLNYADRVYQLPLGLIGIAFGIVLLPSLSKLIRAGDDTGARAQLNRGLELSSLLTIPAAVALAVIALPICTILFERGAFSSADSIATANTLVAYAWGLPAFVLTKIFLPGYFARQDTRTPMAFAIVSMIVNVALALALIGPLGFVGVALATSLAAWVNVACLAVGLMQRGHWAPDLRLLSRLLRIAFAAAAMGAALYLADRYLSFGTTAQVVVLVVLGGSVYAGIAVALGALRPSELRAMFKR